MTVLSVTAPIFLVIALGFLAVRSGLIGDSDVRALGGFVLRVAMPALIFNALSRRPLAEIADARLIGAYAGASLIAFALLFALFARGGRARAACRALGGAAPNSGFVGFPIATLLIGPKATIALALCLIVENVMTIPLALVLAESGSSGRKLTVRELVVRLARNPLMIAIALGAAASLAGLAPPAPIGRAIDLLAAAAPGAALFAIGGGLVGLDFRAERREIAPVATVKLLLHPLALLALTRLAGAGDPDVARAMLVMASAPAFSIYPLICRQFGQERAGAAILLVETALAFPTMSAWALVF
ncbi:MAG: AEC family transporter [Pseudomonadota bacterium]|nr:AEC family transporter [Pseudomonadota bacterium]